MAQPCRIVTINMAPFADLDELRACLDEAGTLVAGADLVVLPETFLGQRGENQQWLPDTVNMLRDFAATHKTYVAGGIDNNEPGKRFNSVHFIDRSGTLVGRYDKRYPYWPELDLDPPVRPGTDTVTWQTELGRFGFATCFDINFPAVWSDLRLAEADLVIWPSAYDGGAVLGAYATIHHYYVLSCTQSGDSRLYDPTGRRIAGLTHPEIRATIFDVDLDTGFYHENFNLDGLERLMADHSAEIEVERLLPEQWIVLRSRRPDISARALAKKYDMEELRHYVARSQQAIDQRR